MQIHKIIFLIIFAILLFGCQSNNNELKKIEHDKNITEKWLKELIFKKDEFGFVGNIRSSLEYEFEYHKEKRNQNFIDLKKSNYPTISTDSSIHKIKDVKILESNSYLFDRSGRLLKEIRLVDQNKFSLKGVDVKNYNFNIHGKLLEYNSIDYNGKLEKQILFLYDKNQRLIESIENEPDFFIKTKISYINDTTIMERVNKRNGVIINKTITKYDQNGGYFQKKQRGDRDYDKKGNLIKITYDGTDFNLPSTSISYDYDFRNNKVRETEYDSIDNVLKTKTFTYDRNNILSQETHISTRRTVIKRFDKIGNIIEYNSIPFYSEFESFTSRWSNFDKNNNKIKSVELKRDSTTRIYENIVKNILEYDKYGNWIAKKVFENDSLTKVHERQLKYY